MAYSMTVFLGFLILTIYSCIGSEALQYNFEFENDMEGWSSFRGNWQWSDRASLGTSLPPSEGNGLVLMRKASDSDELYTPEFSPDNGGSFTLSYFFKSEWVGSSNLRVDIFKNGQQVETILDFTSSPVTSNWKTATASIPATNDDIALAIFCYNGGAAPEGQYLNACAIDKITVEIFGDETTTSAPTTELKTTTESYATTEQLTTTVEPEFTTTEEPEPITTEEPEPTTTEEPEPITTEEPEPSTTEEPEPITTEEPEPTTTEEPQPITTEEPEPSTTEEPEYTTTEEPKPITTEDPEPITTDQPEPTTTEEPEPSTTSEPEPSTTSGPEPSTTSEPELTTTEEPELTTTEEPELTTTEEPELTTTEESAFTTAQPVTTEEPAASTTEVPQGPLTFDFNGDTQGWTLANMNGAFWQRTDFDSTGLSITSPPYGPSVLQIFPSGLFPSTVIAQSPQLEATETAMFVEITFWMDGSRDLPSQLKLRRRQSFDTFDETPIVNMDPYGDQQNFNWITYRGFFSGLQIGETFSVILEGSLGPCVNNSVAVDRVLLDGVKVKPSDLSEFFDFEYGLLGWIQSNMDGGRWALQKWSELDPSLRVPQPAGGDIILMPERFDIHSGIIALESPGFDILPGELKSVHVKFWARGSVIYPATLRLRKKSVDGIYDDLPFLDLTPYGDTDNPGWISLDREYQIPVESSEEQFQLILEADLGGDKDNMIAVDDLRIVTEQIGY